MVCQVCGKSPASVHFTEIVNGKMSELHVCEACAHEKGVQPAQGKGKFWISDLIAGMIDESASGDQERIGHIQCAGCGLLYSTFRETGRLGCPACYESFGTQLRPVLRRIHGAIRHVGKTPARDEGRVERRRALTQLQDALDRAIEHEEFEQAAELRDKIMSLEPGAAPGSPS